LPDKNNDPDLLARISLKDDIQGKIKMQAEQDAPLFQAIIKRRSNRSPFENRRLPEDLLASIKDIAKTNGAWLDVIDDDDENRKNALADLISQGDRIQLSDKRFRRELAAWIHPNRSKSRDGMPGYAHGMTHDMVSNIGPFLIRTFDIGKG
jgi:hypothetical protein